MVISFRPKGLERLYAAVSPNLAWRLELAGAGTARAWLAMQMAYDLAAEKAAGTPEVKRLDSAV